MQLIGLLSECLTWLLASFMFLFLIMTITFLLVRHWVRKRVPTLRPYLRKSKAGLKTVTVGFFHPYCNAGGGGERVLWVAIKCLQEKYPGIKCVVYTGDTDATSSEIIHRARQRFNISLPSSVEFVFLRRRKWVEASCYPVFTLLGQSLGSMVLGWEALMEFVPDLYIDTMGYAFTLPLFKYLGGSRVACYVHYPTISTDMLEQVIQRRGAHNNATFISSSAILSSVKLQYYKSFAYLYGVMGRRSEVVFVNSSWTLGHINQLWGCKKRTFVVYPPCDTSEFAAIPLDTHLSSGCKNIVSIAQFRPEKDHMLQLDSFHEFLNRGNRKDYKLILAGSCRNAGDQERVEQLKKHCLELDIHAQVEFKLNISFSELKELMAHSVVGLHTMWNEHFGIGIVELMAAGTITLAHKSGGPKLDIVVDHDGHITGYLADSVQSYADKMEEIFSLSQEQHMVIRKNARAHVSKFSESEFKYGFLNAMSPMMLGN